MGGNTYYVFADSLGSPRSLVQASTNAEVWRWDSDPYGNAAPSGQVTYNMRFPGQIADIETGLFQNGFRDYDPVAGRYIQSDPIGLKGGLSRYAYVGGNPLSFVDPLGLWAGGISFEFSTINPFTSGGGGSYGLNAQYTSDSGFHFYTYSTPNDVGSTGLLVGPSVQVNVATGTGAWTGDFQSINGSYGLFTGGYFQTPPDQQDPGYAGISFGLGKGPMPLS